MSADAPSPAALDLDAIKRRCDAVVALTHTLAADTHVSTRSFPMSIPPQPEDADMLLLALCADVDALLAAARRGGEDTRRLNEIEWFGCMTGDCPHETQAECDVAILGVVHSVVIEREYARLLRDEDARSAAHPEEATDDAVG